MRRRTVVAAALLLLGIFWSLPMQPGYRDAATVVARYSAAESASFSIVATRTALQLSGHTSSAAHERRLQNTLARRYTDLRLDTEFRPLEIAPDWWDDATMSLLEAISEIDAPRATLTAGGVSIRGVVTDRELAGGGLDTLRSLLPRGAEFDVRLTAVDAAATPGSLCDRAIRMQHFAPVYFEESGTRMRSSAYPLLEQVAAFADACRDTIIAVTGHADSTGDEAYNKALSFDRARVVADWLNERGVDEERLRVTGAGSSVPIADNATRYGRGLNRRIEILFTPAPSD